MAGHKTVYFRVVYYDRDAKTMGISEVMSDDTAINTRTLELKESGRNVNASSTAPVNDPSMVPSIESLKNKLLEGYTYDPNLSW